jgi:hypothetical protein
VVQNQIDWEKWVYGKGNLPFESDFRTIATNSTQDLAEIYEQLRGDSSPDNYKALADTKDNT